MERRQEKYQDHQHQNDQKWIWLGGVPFLMFLFVGDPAHTGLYFTLAVLTVGVAIFLAMLLLKAFLRLVANATAGMIGRISQLRPQKYAARVGHGRLSPARLHHAR
jgi:hypothetical protein